MRNFIIAICIAFSVFCGVVGITISDSVSSTIDLYSESVRPVLVRQAIAQANKLDADALKAQAESAKAQAQADALRAAMPALIISKQIESLSFSCAFSILLIGLASCIVIYLNTRARIVYPNKMGQAPIIVTMPLLTSWKWLTGKASSVPPVSVVDTGLMTTPAMMISGTGKTLMPTPLDQEGMLRLATQSQASRTISAVSNKEDAAHIANGISNTVANLAQALRAGVPQLAQPAPQPTRSYAQHSAGPTLTTRFVRRVTAGDADKLRVDRDASDLAHFIEQGSEFGFTREYWLGRRFPSGEICSKTRWGVLRGVLHENGLLVKEGSGNGFRLSVGPQEAISRLGLGEFYGQEG